MKYVTNRSLTKDASGLPPDPLTRGWYRADKVLAPLSMAIGVVGIVLLIVAGVKYLF